MSLKNAETDILAEVAELEAKIRPLNERLHSLLRELRSIRARAFISANTIKRGDVELSSGDGKPWFGNVRDFTEWLRANSTKNYAEWNTVIYRTSDLLAGRMPEMPAAIGDL